MILYQIDVGSTVYISRRNRITFSTADFGQNLTKIFKLKALLYLSHHVFIIYLLKFKKNTWINFQIE